MLTTWPVTVSMLHPVTDAARLLELDRDAAPQVAERLLRRERQRTGHDGRRRDEAREIDANGVQPVDHVADERQRYDELVQDPRDLASREQRLEREQHEDLDHAERDDRKAGFAREQRPCRRMDRGADALVRPQAKHAHGHDDEHRRASRAARASGRRARSARARARPPRTAARRSGTRRMASSWVRPLGIAAIIGPAPWSVA